MKQYRHGIIGLGSIAGEHIRGIEPLDGLRVAALCNRSPAALERWQKALAIPQRLCFTDYRELLACPEIDSVSICTPNAQHFEMVKAAIEAGKAFAVEKPLCLSLEEGEELRALLEKRPVAHMICFSYRFMPAARYARHLIRSGALGQLRHVFARYEQGWGNDESRPLTWRFQKEKSGYGALGDLGSHLIDLIRFLAGEIECLRADMGLLMPERVLPEGGGRGKVTVDDYAMFLARLEGGVPASFETTRFAYGRRNTQSIAVYGSRGGLVYSEDLIDGELVSSLEGCQTEEDFRANRYTRLEIPKEFHCTQMEAFERLLHGDENTLAATLEDGLACQRVMDAVARSAGNGQWERTEERKR